MHPALLDALLHDLVVVLAASVPLAREGTDAVRSILRAGAPIPRAPRIEGGLHARAPGHAAVGHNRVCGAVDFEYTDRVGLRVIHLVASWVAPTKSHAAGLA